MTSKKGSKSQKNSRVSGAKRSTSVHEGFPRSTSNNYGFSPGRSSKRGNSVYEGFSQSNKSAKKKSSKVKPSSNNEYGWNPNVSIYNTPEGHSVAGKKKKRHSKRGKKGMSNCGL